jgi:hypothetical protein
MPRASNRAIVSSASVGLFAVAERLVRPEARRPEAAEVRDDHAVTRRRQQRDDIDVAVDVVGPAVQQHGRGSVGWALVDVAHVEEAGRDLLDAVERRRRGRS